MTIKLIYEPKVYLIGRTQLDDNVVNTFYADHSFDPKKLPLGWSNGAENDADIIPELAGRLCYMSFMNPRPGGNEAYLQHIKEVGHGSVLEHSVWNFIFTGISRSLSHELVRHRAGWSYSQLSQRFVDESDVAFVVPPELTEEVVACESYADWMAGYVETSGEPAHLAHDAFCKAHPDIRDEVVMAGSAWLGGCESALIRYVRLIEYFAEKLKEVADKTERRKRARQTARSILPNCTETKIFCTANARAIRHFIELRCNRHADTEIRKLAYKVWQVVKEDAPNLFSDYEEVPLPDGTVELTTPYKKV